MTEDELKALRKSIHDLNNRIGVILATAELLQLEQLAGKGLERSKLIEGKALEVRKILRDMSDQFFS